MNSEIFHLGGSGSPGWNNGGNGGSPPKNYDYVIGCSGKDCGTSHGW